MESIIRVGELDTELGTLLLSSSGHITFSQEYDNGSAMVTIAKDKTPEQMLMIMRGLE